jgi:hypothetical protein
MLIEMYFLNVSLLPAQYRYREQPSDEDWDVCRAACGQYCSSRFDCARCISPEYSR